MAPDRGRALDAVAAACDAGYDLRELRVAVLEVVARAVPHDAYAWVATDPVSTVGVAPLALVPTIEALPRIIAGKYREPLNRWTTLAAGTAVGLHAVTGGDLARSAWWRAVLRAEGVTDIASLVVADGYGCWSFLDLWRTGADRTPFDARELGLLGTLGPALARGVRAAVAGTFSGAAPRAAPADGPPVQEGGPVVVVLDDELHILAQTPRTDAHLRDLLPPGPGTSPVPAAAFNVAAQLLAREAGVDDHPATGRVHLGGSRWMTLRADRLGAGSIGVTLEPSTPAERVDLLSRAAGLTPREAQLAGLLLSGRDTRHLAHRMGVSDHTVQDHLKAVFAKTGVSGRAALVARVLGTG